MRTIASLKGTPMSTKLTNSLGLLAITLAAFVGGHVIGFAAATDYYKQLFRKSYMSTDREEAEKASKTLCSMLHFKVQYPDEN